MTDRILDEMVDKSQSYNYVQRLLEVDFQTSDRIDGLIRIQACTWDIARQKQGLTLPTRPAAGHLTQISSEVTS